MAVPSFVPLIGSSFDALAGQQQQWAGFSRAVDEANIARAQQADIQQNRWLEEIARARAEAQSRDLNLQLQANQIARESAADLRRETESKRQFDVGITLDKERIKATNARTAEMSKVADLNTALQQHAAEQKIDSAGQTAANSYLIAKNNAEAANNAYERIQSQIESANEDQQSELAKAPKKRDAAKLATLTLKSKALTASLRQAERDKQIADNRFSGLANAIQNKGFLIDEDNGQIVHPDSGKKWNFKAALDKAKSAVDSGDFGSEISGGATAAGSGGPPSTWAGFSPGTTAGLSTAAPVLATPPISPSSTNVLRIGKYLVTPQ